jgi:hypothetical protein
MSNANERNAEVIKAVKENPDLTYAEISELFNLKPHQVAILANKAGIFRRQRVMDSQRSVKQVQPFTMICHNIVRSGQRCRSWMCRFTSTLAIPCQADSNVTKAIVGSLGRLGDLLLKHPFTRFV